MTNNKVQLKNRNFVKNDDVIKTSDMNIMSTDF